MKRTLPLAAFCAALVCVSSAPGAALAETTPPVTPPVTTPAPPVEAPPAPVAPVAGLVKLRLEKVGGSPPFALVGGRIVVRGVITPYVAEQAVKVSFYRDGHKFGVRTISVLDAGNGTGRFELNFGSADAGLVEARVVHYATPQMSAFSGRTPGVQFVNTNLGPGAKGESVRLLQSELHVLHFAVPLSGVLDGGTARALVAYRKMTGLARIEYAGRQVFKRLERHAGTFHVRYPHDGRHVEGDLTKQVLAEIEPGGRVHAIYTMSSGKPSTPTVIGRFSVYSKTPGTNSEGMVDSNYFIRGYAIHGYHEVPTYAASHGCLRVPIPDAAAIYAWVRYGTPVDVYNEDGGGSARVRDNAGP